MPDKIVDFLIIGVAKCATTSLAYYLDQHPGIELSKQKEPCYLTYDILKDSGYLGPGDHLALKRSVKTLDKYKSLFKPHSTSILKGEASTDTVYYYEHTISKIKRVLGLPKIIIMLRNPVERAISAYSHLVRDERETLDFEAALHAEKERLEKGYNQIWAYVTGGMYFEKVKAFGDHFDEIKVVIFEEFTKDPRSGISEVLDFLQLDGLHEFSEHKHNRSGKSKYRLINRFITKPSTLKTLLKRFISKKWRKQIKNRIQEQILKPIFIPETIKKELYKKFEHDIEMLENHLNKDLSIWKLPYQ